MTVFAVAAGMLWAPSSASAEQGRGIGATTATTEAGAAGSAQARAQVLMAWQTGGPEVRAAAEQALLGVDADIDQFLATIWEQRQAADERLSVGRVVAASGPSVRAAGRQALDSTDPAAVEAFLRTGWQAPSAVDQRLRVSQLMANGGPRLRAVGQAALNVGTPEALQAFITSGWQQPHAVDQRIRVTQIMNAGGAEVRKYAQRALGTGTLEAYATFVDSQWAVAAARDQETSAVADLAGAAVAASQQATQQTEIAKEESAKATAAAEAARQAAANAAAAVERARNNAREAAAAARQAADAANGAARAAREAISASRAATEAARVAASAAARAASAAALTEKAATRAHKAAANAATDAGQAAAARDAAKAARDVALTAKKAADAADQAGNVAREAQNASRAAGSATAQAILAMQAAEQAAQHLIDTGANAQEAIAAANRARENAARATRAANASAAFAGQAANAAHRARDAAMRAVGDANAAAAAADEAAAHAGEAAEAARRSTEAANAATGAANEAVAAAQEARAVFDAARTADAERIAVATEEGVQAAREALASLVRYGQRADAESQEATKRGTEVNALLALAAAPGTGRAEAVAAGRKVALALTQSQGLWTRQAALDALGGTDDAVLEFARTGVGAAAAQDDRVTVSGMIANGSDAMARAAETALAASDADVANFLRTGDYPERLAEERLAVGQVLSAARDSGDTVLAQRAQQVLADGTEPVMRRFLTVEQFDVAAVGDRVRVGKILSDDGSGPELKAAAQIALAGPSAALREFLDQGQHAARQRDLEAAEHEAEVSALLSQATAAATTATQQALEAQAVAATARGKQAEAEDWARQARASAEAAADYAAQAVASADQAQKSAEQAEASARTAAAAAASAAEAARQAGRSAAWAQDSYQRATSAANEAYESANAARQSAIQAGKDADTANGYYWEAYNAAVTKAENERQEENLRRNAICRAENLPGTQGYKDCVHHLTDSDTAKLGKAMVNGELCNKMASPGSAFLKNCLYDTFNPNFGLNRQLDIAHAFVVELQAIAMATGVAVTFFVGAVACNALCGTVLGLFGGAEALMGVGGLVDFWLTSEWLNLAVGAAAGAKTFATLRGPLSIRLAETFAEVTVSNEAGRALLARLALGLKRCAMPGNSFTAATPVLLADGTSRAIGQVRVGDRVLATDPETGTTGGQRVTHTIAGTGEKRLVDVTVEPKPAVAGGAPAVGPRPAVVAGSAVVAGLVPAAGPVPATGAGSVTATENHPFWVADLRRWVPAGQLRRGEWLRTSSGTWAQVTAVSRRTERTTVHNLSVANVHTYYALAGGTPVLVHNDDPCDVALGYRREGLAQWAESNGFKHFVGPEMSDPLNTEWMGPVQAAIENGAITLHVRLDGFPAAANDREAFLFMAFAGVGRRSSAQGTQREMAWIARELYNGSRSWGSVKFYVDGRRIDLGPEPDWWNLVDKPIRVYIGDFPRDDKYLTKAQWQAFLTHYK